ncbi:hypothetical protein ACF1AO_32000 [Streptomyces longwoodensis]|uniref:hypothetical protein n=1 Tax=Streptomyces longwoodensis TaxID=68231 RepID=UPI0036FFC045
MWGRPSARWPGTCVGYLVQADHDPTSEGRVAPLSAAQDRQVATDGDLRKLLGDRPKGAKDTSALRGRAGWITAPTRCGRRTSRG